jgi:hypothetical protein
LVWAGTNHNKQMKMRVSKNHKKHFFLWKDKDKKEVCCHKSQLTVSLRNTLYFCYLSRPWYLDKRNHDNATK